jgi:hypothetical protein
MNEKMREVFMHELTWFLENGSPSDTEAVADYLISLADQSKVEGKFQLMTEE